MKKKKLLQSDYNMCITSYNYILNDSKLFNRRTWNVVIVDECDRLKNLENKFS